MAKLDELIQDRAVKIALYMQTTMGVPFEVFEMEFNGKNKAEQLWFINKFAEEHSKVVTPIYYKDTQNG